jgi:hypothetical protein
LDGVLGRQGSGSRGVLGWGRRRGLFSRGGLWRMVLTFWRLFARTLGALSAGGIDGKEEVVSWLKMRYLLCICACTCFILQPFHTVLPNRMHGIGESDISSKYLSSVDIQASTDILVL